MGDVTESPAAYKEKFFEGSRDLQELKTDEESTTIGEFHNIDEDEDEVWLMQCPKGMDLAQLQHQKLKLPGRSHFDEVEAVAVENSHAGKRQAFGYVKRKGRYALRLLPVRGSIVLRKTLKSNEVVTEEKLRAACAPTGRVPVPAWIKVRHPLLGAKFEEKLQLDKHIAKRLRKADEASTRILHETRLNQKKAVPATKNTKTGEEALVEVKTEKRSAAEGETSSKKKLKVQKSHAEEVPDDLKWLKDL